MKARVYPIKMGDKGTKHFLIGTLERPKNFNESQGRRGKWCVQTVNMWAATLGKRLTFENAIPYHLTIVLHELTHIMSEVSRCHSSWDDFLFEIINEAKK